MFEYTEWLTLIAIVYVSTFLLLFYPSCYWLTFCLKRVQKGQGRDQTVSLVSWCGFFSFETELYRSAAFDRFVINYSYSLFDTLD